METFVDTIAAGVQEAMYTTQLMINEQGAMTLMLLSKNPFSESKMILAGVCYDASSFSTALDPSGRSSVCASLCFA